MQENILQEYEKVKDKLSEEEFLEEMERMKSSNEDVDFIDDFSAAQLVVQNHLGVDTTIFENKEEASSDMSDELKQRFDKVKDQISEEEFFERIEKFRQQEIENPFMTDTSLADMVVGELITEEPEMVSEKPEFAVDTIDKLEANSRDVTVSGRVISISNPRSFKTRKGQNGQVQNVELKDNTGEIRAVFWTQNIRLLKEVKEGDDLSAQLSAAEDEIKKLM